MEDKNRAKSKEMGDFVQMMRQKYGLNLEELHRDEETEDAEFEIVEPKSISSGGFIPNENGGMDYIEPKQLPPIDNKIK